MRSLALAVAVAATFLAGAVRAEWKGGTQAEVRLEGGEQSWLVRATLNGRPSGLFLLDTGATVCVLTPDLAERARVEPTGQDVDIQTANGVVHAPLVRIRSVEVGGNRAHDVMAVVHAGIGPSADGVIGLSFLNQFSYAIDPKRRVLRLR